MAQQITLTAEVSADLLGARLDQALAQLFPIIHVHALKFGLKTI